jgi:hypothetical protein
VSRGRTYHSRRRSGSRQRRRQQRAERFQNRPDPCAATQEADTTAEDRGGEDLQEHLRVVRERLGEEY